MIDSSSDRAILLRYNEIALKGDNRGWFEDRLAINTRRMLARALDGTKVEITRQHSRLILHAPWNEKTREALARVFGLSSFSPMRAIPTNRDALCKFALEELEAHVARHGMPKTFRVQTRRTEKALPESSIDLDRLVGGFLLEAHPQLKVDLEKPELIVGIELRFERSYVWTEKFAGHGGLPVGSNGPLLTLISGGLDSPVAAIKALRRGSSVSFLHFWGAPFVGEEVLRKVEDLVRLVNRFHPDPQPLLVVPFGKIQEKIALASNPKTRTILYRRLMIRIACEVARRLELNALITGESLGQVASQTVENMATIDAVATLPILRPLITFDKDEIIREAQSWGTYEKSIEPATDCCTLFADRHPAIRTNPAMLDEIEAALPIAEFVKEAVESLETRRV